MPISHSMSLLEDVRGEVHRALSNFTKADLYDDYSDMRQSSKVTGILRSLSAITSTIASAILIWMVWRSYKRLSCTYHRLLLGVCIADIIFSLSQALFNVMAPEDASYLVWNAWGDVTTCSIQGFVRFLGGMSGQLYNCSLNFYYLALVRYEKSDEEIRTKIEPFLHGVPVTVALLICIISVAMKNINVSEHGNCWAPVYDLPHCDGLSDGNVPGDGEFEIACFRGSEGGGRFLWICLFLFATIPPIIIFTTLGMIYQTVWRQEKRQSQYGAESFRESIRSASTTDTPGGGWQSIRRMSSISLRGSSTTRGINASGSRGNTAPSPSRAVLAKAVAYSIAYLLTWSGGLVVQILVVTGNDPPAACVYLAVILMPLQGLYNLLIFMYPKVIHAKQNGNLTWWQAFKKAFLSRGNKRQQRRRSQARSGRPSRKNRNGNQSNGNGKKKNKPTNGQEKFGPEKSRRVSFYSTDVTTTVNPSRNTTNTLHSVGNSSLRSSLKSSNTTSLQSSQLTQSLPNPSRSIGASTTTTLTNDLQDSSDFNSLITNEPQGSPSARFPLNQPEEGDIEQNISSQIDIEINNVDEENCYTHDDTSDESQSPCRAEKKEEFPLSSSVVGEGQLTGAIENDIEQHNE